MTIKTYKFTYDEYWTSNGCDCCEPDHWEVYNSEDVDCSLGSARSVQECYAQAIISYEGLDNLTEDELDYIYSFSEEELRAACKLMGITVEIIE